VALDAIGLGLRTSPNGRAIGVAGDVEATLFVAGPLARGEFGNSWDSQKFFQSTPALLPTNSSRRFPVLQ
jgi:uncharacterized NAD(P)/FAD-binding protein YdhS